MNSYQQLQIVVKFNIPLFYRYFYNHLSNYTKTIIRLRLVNIGEYSPRLRLGEYSPRFTSPSANNCQIYIYIYIYILIYYMASSESGQYAANSVF